MGNLTVAQMEEIRQLRIRASNERELQAVKQKIMVDYKLSAKEAEHIVTGTMDMAMIILSHIQKDSRGRRFFEFPDGIKVYV